MLKFSEATENDLPEIVALFADDMFGKDREVVSDPVLTSYQQAFAEMQKNKNAHLIVLKKDKLIVGVAQLDIIPTLVSQGAKRGLIEGVRIHQNYRSQGLGKSLIEHVVHIAEAQGCTLIELTTNKARVDAHRFYKQLGFADSHVGFKLIRKK